MVNGYEESDPAIVARKPTNGAEQSVAESVERRAGAEGSADRQSTRRAQNRVSVAQALNRVREVARKGKERFIALLHHISVALLRQSFYELKHDAAPGVDGMRWTDYEVGLEPRLGDLHGRVQRGAYRALPSRRRYIPKPDGRQRPLAVRHWKISKIVQRATVAVLNTIYEEDFLGFSYGFRPKRSPHDALDALSVGITSTKVNYILDADVARFFETVSQESLIRFLKHRIGARRIIRLIQKWLKAGVVEDGVAMTGEQGQGSVVSPSLANVYLHYVFDLWAQRWRRREATGDMIIVRYADDIVVGFQHETDAWRFQEAMRARFKEFSLTLHPEKTRLIEFGRYAASNRKQRGLGKPETFTFLGFSFICGCTRRGQFQLKRHTRRDRMRVKLKEIKEELRRRMHQPIPEQRGWLRQVVTGFFNYHAADQRTGTGVVPLPRN